MSNPMMAPAVPLSNNNGMKVLLLGAGVAGVVLFGMLIWSVEAVGSCRKEVADLKQQLAAQSDQLSSQNSKLDNIQIRQGVPIELPDSQVQQISTTMIRMLRAEHALPEAAPAPTTKPVVAGAGTTGRSVTPAVSHKTSKSKHGTSTSAKKTHAPAAAPPSVG